MSAAVEVRFLFRGPNVSGRKRKHEEDERQTIPNILQGEVARLDVKFLVNLDPSYCSNNGTVHLVCKLGESLTPAGHVFNVVCELKTFRTFSDVTLF